MSFAAVVRSGARNPVVRPGGTSHKITISGTSARNSTAFASDTEQLRIASDTDLWYLLGGSGVEATTSDVFLPAGVVEIIQIAKTQNTHIAAIQDSASGFFNVVEIG